MKQSNRPTHYKTKGKAKEKSTTFYLPRSLLSFLREVAEFERISLNIILERSLHYARNKDFKKANARKKKAKIFTKKKSKYFYQKAKQKREFEQKRLFV